MNKIDKTNYNDDIFIQKKEIKELQKEYNKYLNPKMRKKIARIINLRETIFENKELDDFLYEKTSFREITKYNIINIVLRMFEKIELDSDKDFLKLNRIFNVVNVEYDTYNEKISKIQSYVVFELQMSSNKININIKDIDIENMKDVLSEDEYRIALNLKKIYNSIIEVLKLELGNESDVDRFLVSKSCIVARSFITRL